MRAWLSQPAGSGGEIYFSKKGNDDHDPRKWEKGKRRRAEKVGKNTNWMGNKGYLPGNFLAVYPGNRRLENDKFQQDKKLSNVYFIDFHTNSLH